MLMEITKNEQTRRPNSAWNISCDTETHEALDFIGAWLVGSKATDAKIPKTQVVKILAKEKLESLGLIHNQQKGAAN